MPKFGVALPVSYDASVSRVVNFRDECQFYLVTKEDGLEKYNKSLVGDMSPAAAVGLNALDQRFRELEGQILVKGCENITRKLNAFVIVDLLA